MSYYILRKDLVIDINENEILYLTLGGCNNDSKGRTWDDWHGEIINKNTFIRMFEYEKTLPSNDFCIKYRSKFITQKQHGKHLETMYKKRIRFEDKKVSAWFSDYVIVNGEKFEDFDEANKRCNEILHKENSCSWNCHRQWLNDLEEIVKRLKENKPLAFAVL